MNIKSLLIGSAAATVAATGAQAADAVFVPEPEPMEYVRVCDVYGAGFFYIPGTETCLKIGGYVRYEIGFHEDDDGWRKLARGTLTIDARSETELGTLGGFIELRANSSGTLPTFHADNEGDYLSNGVGSTVGLQQAIISLGGLSMGLSDTLYDAGLSGEFDSGGGSRVHFIRYTMDVANGAYVSVALEEADGAAPGWDYTPNVVGNVGVAQAWGAFNVWGAYDATAEEWAAKAIGKFNVTQALVLEALATYESGHSFYSVSNGTPAGYEWSAGAYLKFAATPKLSLGAGAQYFSDQHNTGADDWAAGAVIDYEVVQNLATKLAINYRDGDSYGDDGEFSGFLRIDRKF